MNAFFKRKEWGTKCMVARFGLFLVRSRGFHTFWLRMSLRGSFPAQCRLETEAEARHWGGFWLLLSHWSPIEGGRTIWHRTIWHWTIWHQDNLAPGQFGTGQFGTRTIWHQHNKNGQFGTGQFGTRTIWHQHNKTDNLAPRKKWHPNYSLTI